MGTIILPKDNNYISYGRYLNLFKPFAERNDFKIVVTDKYFEIEDNLVIIFKSPEYHSPHILDGIADLSKDKILIGYWTDIHYENTISVKTVKEDKIYKENMTKILNRCDYILCPYKYTFQKLWPDFVNKFILFPHFVNCLAKEINQTPIERVLLSGAVNNAYPFRKQIKHKMVDILIHPGYSMDDDTIKEYGYKIGTDFYAELYKYIACIATHGKMEYVVGKYFEILATGSLLLGSYTPDLDELGFKNEVNYIQISVDNWKDIVEDVIYNPDKYLSIRESGLKFIKKNHTIDHRLNQLQEIVNEASSRL